MMLEGASVVCIFGHALCLNNNWKCSALLHVEQRILRNYVECSSFRPRKTGVLIQGPCISIPLLICLGVYAMYYHEHVWICTQLRSSKNAPQKNHHHRKITWPWLHFQTFNLDRSEPWQAGPLPEGSQDVSAATAALALPNPGQSPAAMASSLLGLGSQSLGSVGWNVLLLLVCWVDLVSTWDWCYKLPGNLLFSALKIWDLESFTWSHPWCFEKTSVEHEWKKAFHASNGMSTPLLGLHLANHNCHTGGLRNLRFADLGGLGPSVAALKWGGKWRRKLAIGHLWQFTFLVATFNSVSGSLCPCKSLRK